VAAVKAPVQKSTEPLLALQGVTKRFGSLLALSDASLDIVPGEVHCILGENGAGKSTLCNLIFGVHLPDQGTMRFDGRSYHPASPADALTSGIAMVHQHFSLVHDMTVVDNVILGQQRGLVNTRAWSQRLERLADDYGFALDPSAKIDDLSVGERQRVEIVKCLIREPRLFLLDEPTAVLLPDEIGALLDVCRRVAENGCAVVLVTHKLAEIKKAADRVTVLRGGRVVARSDHPAEEIDALVRAMIQGDLKSLDKTAASMLGMENTGTGRAKQAPSAETPAQEGGHRRGAGGQAQRWLRARDERCREYVSQPARGFHLIRVSAAQRTDPGGAGADGALRCARR
jgi:simple sugar transport system ATP-binding protein